ncbi:hypothetical protein [Pseudomonas indica]|uniref:Uncharacterized protein n=1 Tax=Pseudomonas indica TaxID=137658 RepID=A0A1G8V562_9PSED|nr:hypothetical protein [Pseudomonas indica]SDJ61222.1 hypothetical protein SAMN05216186_102102 [Pseudomonas indica]
MAWVKETAIIAGQVKCRLAGTGRPFVPMGLGSTMEQAHEVNKIVLPNTMTVAGGNYDKFSRVTAMTLSFNFREFFSANYARFLWANVTELPSAPVTGEQVIAEVGNTSMLAKMPLSITKVTDAATGLVEFEEDIDWRLTGSGPEPLPGSALATAIEAASGDYLIEVDYTSALVDEIQPLANTGIELELLFEGVNAVGTQKRTNNLYYRCSFDLVESLSWINVEDFMGFNVSCEVLADPARQGPGLSPYMKILKEKPVAA